MARKRTGGIQPFTRADGTVYYRARVRLGDGSRVYFDIPEKHQRDEDDARHYAARLQRLEDAEGGLLAAKQQTTEPVSATVETCDAWYERYFAYQRELGRSAAKDARYSWRA